MTQLSTPAGAAPAPKNLPARFIGVLTAPRETFRSIAAHPKWFGMLVATTLIVMVFTILPMTTEEGKQAALDQQVSQMEAFGRQVDDAGYERMRQGMAFAPYFAAASILVFAPVMALVISGILFAVFNAAMGGEASFKQLFSVVVHAGAVSALGTVFTGPLNYFRGAVGSATNLRVLLPMVEEKSFVGRLLGMTDLFIIWWLVVLAIGLAVLYRRRTQPIAITLLGVYAVIALAFAAFMSGVGG
jgi:Yip1-like protein